MKRQVKPPPALLCASALVVLFFYLISSPAAAMQVITNSSGNTSAESMDAPYEPITTGMGCWIWSSQVFDRQTCLFWRAFDISATNDVVNARLRMTADNEFTLFLDGRELGRGMEWRELFDFNITPLLSPGHHVLAVEAFNASGFAGLLIGLRINLADGQIMEVKSDSSWRVVPQPVRGWKTMAQPLPQWAAASEETPLGGSPWWTEPQHINIMPTLFPVKVYFWQTGWFQIGILTVCGLVILISLRLMAQLAAHRKEEALLYQERARIARDIHDDVGSRMTQLVLNGEVMQSELAADSGMRPQLDRICQEAREVLSTMDEILWAVNPRRDTLRDFSAYVCGYTENFLKSTGILCLYEVDPEMSFAALDLPRRRSLLMAIKEALNNVVKHSGATELKLQIQWQNGKLMVVVQDNGRGFDPARSKSERNGLGNLYRRIGELDGSCAISSQPGQGCRVEFVIPLEPQHRFRWSKLWGVRSENLPAANVKNSRFNEAGPNYDPSKC